MGSPAAWLLSLRIVRAPLLLLVLAGLLLVLPEQTKDMLAALQGPDAGWAPLVAFHATLAILSVSAWYWSRTLLAASFKVPDNRASRTVLPRLRRQAYEQIPRLMYILAVLLGVTIAVRSSAWANIFFVFCWAAPIGMIVYFRLPLHMTARVSHRWPIIRYVVRLAPLVEYAPIYWLLPIIGFSMAMTIFIWGSLDHVISVFLPGYPGLPLLATTFLHGPSVGILAIALMIAPLSVLTFFFDQGNFRKRGGWWVLLRHPPVMTAFVVWILVMPTIFSLHRVRTTSPASEAYSVNDRKDLATLFSNWTASCHTVSQTATGIQTVSPIIVAVSGGATRAAVWAERILYEVEDMTADGSARVFAVSSVSGGSLGAAAYMAALASLTPADRCDATQRQKPMELLKNPGISQDALGPLLAGAFLDDIPRSMFGPVVAFLQWLTGDRGGGGDRAEAIERGFERLWAASAAKEKNFHPFSTPYLSLFYDAHGAPLNMPLWLANGTDMGTGNRLMTVPFSTKVWPFPAGEDALGMLQADVSISTTINNSARFPYLDPSGELNDRHSVTRVTPLDQPDLKGMTREIIDGGYFDNSGLQTALDLATWLREDGPGVLAKAGHGSWYVDPIIVLATADGDILPTERVIRCEADTDDPEPLHPTPRPLQLLVPFEGLLNLRAAHAAILINEARTEYCPDTTPPVYRCDAATGLPIRCTTVGGVRQRFFHFYLPANGNRPLPLNWVLSDATARFIWIEAMNEAGNPREASIMRQVLASKMAVETAKKVVATQ